MNIGRSSLSINNKELSFKGHQSPTAEMMAFSSKYNRDRFLLETENVRKNDLIDGQSPLSFLKDRAKEIINAFSENSQQNAIKSGLNLVG